MVVGCSLVYSDSRELSVAVFCGLEVNLIQCSMLVHAVQKELLTYVTKQAWSFPTGLLVFAS